jgi:hypothetical protein
MCVASRVGVGLGNPRAPCQTMPGQVMPCRVVSLRVACRHRLAAGEPARTVPSHALCAIPGEACRARAGFTPRGPASLAWATLFQPVWCCGWAAVGRARTVHVGCARILAQWPV